MKPLDTTDLTPIHPMPAHRARNANRLGKRKGYVTVKCGNEPIVALRSVSGDAMRLASSTQRQPR
jgi:hypothetical protein